MYNQLKFNVLNLLLILVAGICLPMALHGQTDPVYSIAGHSFCRFATPPGFPEPVTSDMRSMAVVTLEAGGEIFETKTDDKGRFAFPEIHSRLVRLIISVEYQGQRAGMFVGTIELMPGENFVLFQSMSNNSQASPPAITVEGDKWIYHIVGNMPGLPFSYTEWTVEKLKSLPGAEYNRRKETITFSGDALRRTEIVAEMGTVYVFGLNPDAAE